MRSTSKGLVWLAAWLNHLPPHMLSKKDVHAAELETVRVSTTLVSANKRESNSVCQRTGVVRDSEAPRRYTGSALAWNNSAKNTDIPTSGPVVKCQIWLNMAEGFVAIPKNHVPIVGPALSTGSSSSSTCTSSTSFQQDVARGMGSPRRASNRWRRTRERPKPACVRSPFHRWWWHTQAWRGELTSFRGTVQSAWLSNSSETHKAERLGCPFNG